MKSRLDRRTFLKDASALTVSAAVLAAGAPIGASPLKPDGARISAVLFDGRYSSCRAFADMLARNGARAFNVQPDAAALWYGPLRDHLATCGGCVAGLTTFSDSMLSQSCGRDLGLSLRYEGAHDSRGSDALKHQLRASAGVDEIAGALRGADADWAEALAAALARSTSISRAGRRRSAIALATRVGDHPGFLQSWLLAKKMPGCASAGSG
jgi:hypothetical protein